MAIKWLWSNYNTTQQVSTSGVSYFREVQLRLLKGYNSITIRSEFTQPITQTYLADYDRTVVIKPKWKQDGVADANLDKIEYLADSNNPDVELIWNGGN